MSSLTKPTLSFSSDFFLHLCRRAVMCFNMGCGGQFDLDAFVTDSHRHCKSCLGFAVQFRCLNSGRFLFELDLEMTQWDGALFSDDRNSCNWFVCHNFSSNIPPRSSGGVGSTTVPSAIETGSNQVLRNRS
jgi:hypothetical protein